MWLYAADGRLKRLEFEGPAETGGEEYPLLLEAQRQLAAYFAGELHLFELPLAPEGTPFQRAVWEAVAAIPYGETRTYAEIAAVVGRPRAARPVGQAVGANPLPLIVPCHRVVGQGGALTGYGGGLERKTALLALESGRR